MISEPDQPVDAAEHTDDAEGRRASGLTPQQDRAIVALLNEPNVAKAATAAGVGERTLYRWLAEDDRFKKAFLRARREAFSQAIGMMQRYAPAAVNALAKVFTDSTAPHSSRVSAASAVLKYGREGIELDDLAARVESLEAAAAKSEQQKGWRR
jgi:hypothetical protein